jgi:hypothetical protein
VARNKAAAEFAKVAADRGGGWGGEGEGIGGVMTSLLIPPPPPQLTAADDGQTGGFDEEENTVAVTSTAAATTTAMPAAAPSSAAMAARREADALVALKASSFVKAASSTELKTLRDALERTANDYDRVKRSLAWSEELRKEEEVEAGSKLSKAEGEYRLASKEASKEARLLAQELKDESERAKGFARALTAAREDIARCEEEKLELEKQAADANKARGDLRKSVNELGRGKFAAEDERDSLRARLQKFDSLAAAVDGSVNDLARYDDPRVRQAITAERWRAVEADDNCKLAQEEALHWKQVADHATSQLNAMQSEMVERLEAQCAALNMVIERERETLGGSVEREKADRQKADRRCAELRRECEELRELRVASDVKAADSKREALVALEAAAAEAEKAAAAMAAAEVAEEEARRATRESFEFRAALAVVRDQDVTAAVERGIERGAGDRLMHLRLQLGLATAEVAQLLRERDAARDQMKMADKHIEAEVAFERATQRDVRAAAEAAFEVRLKEAQGQRNVEGRAEAREAEIRRSMAEASTVKVAAELDEARLEIKSLEIQVSAAEASIAALCAVGGVVVADNNKVTDITHESDDASSPDSPAAAPAAAAAAAAPAPAAAAATLAAAAAAAPAPAAPAALAAAAAAPLAPAAAAAADRKEGFPAVGASDAPDLYGSSSAVFRVNGQEQEEVGVHMGYTTRSGKQSEEEEEEGEQTQAVGTVKEAAGAGAGAGAAAGAGLGAVRVGAQSLQMQLAVAVRAAVDVVQASARQAAAATLEELESTKGELQSARDDAREVGLYKFPKP